MGEEAAQPILGIAPLEDGLWFIAEAAFDIAQQEGMDEYAQLELARFMGECAQLPATHPRHLCIRQIRSRLPRTEGNAKSLCSGVYPADVNAWLNACGVPYRWRRESPTKHHDPSPSISSTSLTSCDVPASSDAEETPQDRDIAAPDLQRIGLMQRNKEVVLKALRDAGHDPLALEPRPPGKAWKPKADARSRSGLSTATFDHAWKALNAENRIKERQ